MSLQEQTPSDHSIAKKPGHRWPKGVSDNPNGRPKLHRNIQQLARANTERAFRTIIKSMRCGVPSVELAAAQTVLERGWGKAPIKIDMEIQSFETFSPEARSAIDRICQLLSGQAGQMPDQDVLDITPQAIEPPKQSGE